MITTNRGGYIFKMNTKKLSTTIFFGTIKLEKGSCKLVYKNL